MIELNLLEKKEPFRMPVVLGMDFNELNLMMLFVSMLIWFIPQMVFDSYSSGKNAELTKESDAILEKVKTIKKEISKNGNIKEMLSAYQKQVVKLNERSGQVEEILKKRTNPKKVLEKLARSVPDDLWFDNLKIVNDEITISGGAYTNRSLGEFMTLINDSPYFAGSITPVKQ